MKIFFFFTNIWQFFFTASEAGSDVGSSIPSPWQPGILHPTGGVATPTSIGGPRASRKIRGSKPKAFRKQPSHIKNELCFAMKPPPCIVSLRKKVRNLRRKRRQPYVRIVMGAFLMQFEAQAVKTRPPKRPIEIDRIKKSSRIESNCQKLTANANKKSINGGGGGGGLQIQIQAWKSSSGGNKNGSSSGSSTSSGLPPSAPPSTRPTHLTSSLGVTKVKSELCPVTETCTAATLPPATPSMAGGGGSGTPNNKHRVKTEKTVSLSVASSGMLSTNTPTSGKSMPITPTIARIKNDGRSTHSIHSHGEFQSTSLISPDMQRVKVEIGHSPFNYRTSPADMAPRLPTSPVPHPLDVRDGPAGHFISPRKRSMLREFDNGSPSLKRHRLSTDSRGSSSEGGGAGSPASSSAAAASPPRHNNGGGRVSSFSIDSIMSGGSTGSGSGGSGGGATLHRPVPIPASPARVNDLRNEGGRGPPKSPARGDTSPVSTPAPAQPSLPQLPHTPLVVPITPYQSRGTPSGLSQIDPRLAHLAGVAADPRFGLTPTFSPAAQMAAAAAVMSSMNPYYSPFAAPAANSSLVASLAQIWNNATPPPSSTTSAGAATATPSTTSSNSNVIPSSGLRSSLSRQSSGGNATPPPSSTTPTRPFSPWTPQYRGEPKVSTPTSKASELVRKHTPSIGSESGGELFNLF